MTHICVGKLTNIGSDNGLSPGRRQAIILTNAAILLIGPLGTNFSESLIIIHTFSFNKIQLKMSSAKCRRFCLGLNVLMLVTLTSGRLGSFWRSSNMSLRNCCAPWNTVWCHENTVNFLQNPHNRHPIACPWGQRMGCLWWVWSLINLLLLSLLCCM